MLAAMLSVCDLVLSDAEKKLLENSNPLGVSLFGRNIANKEQLKKLIKEIKEVIGRDDVLIAVDQEGGRVRRLKDPQWNAYMSEHELDNEDMVKYHSQLIAHDLREVGINWNYAPVVDVVCNQTTEALKSRCFSDDEKTVAKYGRIMVDEYKKAGICPCIKHIPGHGRAVVDPHLFLPVLNQSLRELEKDFYPFIALAKHAPAAMSAHIVLSCIDDKPVTQSKKVIKNIIREMIGFDGLLISDSIDMNALKGSIGQRAKASLQAGCDCVCYCSGDIAELKEVVDNTTQMSDKAMERFFEIKKILENENKIDENAKNYYKCVKNDICYDANYDITEVLNIMKKKGK